MEETEVILDIINQIFLLHQKVSYTDLKHERNFLRLLSSFEKLKLKIVNPLGEKYTLTRLDCDANITGDQTKSEYDIIEVLKPIVYFIKEDQLSLIQKAVIIAK